MSRLLPLFFLLTACPGGDDSADDSAAGGDEIAVCEPDHNDGYTLDGLALDGDVLEATVSYGGGCLDHDWQLCWGGSFMESDPVQAALSLGHDAHGDACEEYVTDTLRFDLTLLKQSWIESYGASTGTIVLNLDDQSLTYTF